jgi:hypothetical protein
MRSKRQRPHLNPYNAENAARYSGDNLIEPFSTSTILATALGFSLLFELPRLFLSRRFSFADWVWIPF